MTFGEYRNNIINLGFEEADIFDENPKHLIEASNRALIFLNSQVEPKIKVKHITLTDSEDYQEIDVSDFEQFDSISHIPPKKQGISLSDYYYEDETLYIKAPGETVSITYNAVPELIPLDAEDDYKIDIKMKLMPLLQLMTAYYVWLDDDERKAVYYYNQFQEMSNLYLSEKSRNEKEAQYTAYIEGGIDI